MNNVSDVIVPIITMIIGTILGSHIGRGLLRDIAGWLRLIIPVDESDKAVGDGLILSGLN